MAKTEYTLPEHKKFVKDMEKAGLEVSLYHGRFFWHGPSVHVDDLQEALSRTKIKCQWDNLGRGFVVYPKVTDYTLEGVRENNES